VAELEASAREDRGLATGEMRMRSRLRDDGPGTRVELEQSIRLAGRLSGFIASALVRQAAEFVLSRFAECVRARLEGRGRGGAVGQTVR
jgi:carbon monoxide dehydrogenase subunit G